MKKYTPRAIGKVAQWKGDSDVGAELRGDGRLATLPDGTPEIHAWNDYAGKLIEKGEAEKNRSRRRREVPAWLPMNTKQRKGNRRGPPDTIQRRAPSMSEAVGLYEQRFAELWKIYPKKAEGSSKRQTPHREGQNSAEPQHVV